MMLLEDILVPLVIGAIIGVLVWLFTPIAWYVAVPLGTIAMFSITTLIPQLYYTLKHKSDGK